MFLIPSQVITFLTKIYFLVQFFFLEQWLKTQPQKIIQNQKGVLRTFEKEAISYMVCTETRE